MSIDQRLRRGLRPAATDPGPDTMAALDRVEQRAGRLARRTKVGVGALLAAAVVLTIGGTVAVQRDDRPDTDQLAVDGTSTTDQRLEGTYVVDVADSPASLQEGMAGRWVVSLEPNGVLEVRPPPDYSGATLGIAYRVEGDQLRTDALVEPGCQADSSFVGTYDWALTGDTLSFTVVEDECAARRILFTGQVWERAP